MSPTIERDIVQGKKLDVGKVQDVTYAVPLWVRDEQIRQNIARIKARVQPSYKLRPERIAVVCFGPSLNQTWEKLKDFKYLISCSGAHKFIVDRGIIPTYHLEVDPRPHKIHLIGQPHPDVEYLIASACSPKVFDHLQGYNVKLWHIFDTSEEGLRVLPPGEWSITGGCSVGLRALTMARFLGFRDLHVFGMDGSEGDSGKHAADHPNQAKKSFETVYKGKTYYTTPGFLEAARGTFHELNQMKDVKATFYGDGLVQAMAKDYVPEYKLATGDIAVIKPELITSAYRVQNAQLHAQNIAYGVGGGKHAETIVKLKESINAKSILDYGCGRGYLQKALDFPIWEYDPAIPGKQDTPRAADLVVCTDVLEHVEPEKLGDVLADLKRCVKQIGYFVINTGPALKTLPDGRNTHLIQQNEAWWKTSLSSYFNVAKIWTKSNKITVLVAPLNEPKKAKKGPIVAQAVPVMGLHFGEFRIRRDPYMIGSTANVLDPNIYRELSESFPPIQLFKAFEGGDVKFSLSERWNPDKYEEFVQSSPRWKEFHAYIKSDAFRQKMQRLMNSYKIPVDTSDLRARFEFSILPANGGLLRPHTDISSKVITLVIGMQPLDEPWNAEWGGGTDIFKQTKPEKFIQDYTAEPGDLELVHTYPYVANQCVVFVKTDQSWHSVGPLTGPEGKVRKTVTINLERQT